MTAWPFTGESRHDALARHRNGLELLQRNQASLALAEFQQAVQLDPDNAEFLKSRGNAERALGNLQGAVESYRRSLEAAPEYLPALYNMGLVLREMNRLEEAESYFRRVHELDPRDPDALFHLGALLHRRSQFADAAKSYRLALELAPGNPHLWLYLGKTYGEIPAQLHEAIRCLRKCLELEPGLAEAHYQLGLAHKNLGRGEEAVACYRKTLELEPHSAEAHDGLGNVLQEQGRLDEAIEHYREAIRLSPDSPVAHSNLGCALVRKGRLNEALRCFLEAIDLHPDFAGAHLNLGNLHSLRGERDQALRCFDIALRIRPDDAAAREGLLFEMQHVCDWSRFEELCTLQRRSLFGHPQQPVSPFSLLSIPSTPMEQLQCAKNYAERQLGAVARDRERMTFRFERNAGRKTRVGYLSADFREHVVARLAVELFELHDRSRFEITAYSYGIDDGSAMRARLSRAFDRFVDIGSLSYADAAARIHADQIDILVDLQGYTQHARTEIMALRPAPVQVNFLGYTGTMGASFIDYAVVDRFVAPPGADAAFSEALVRLPESLQVNSRVRPMVETPLRRNLGLPDKSFVFCCFNQTYKILPEIFAIWMRLLEAVPGSVLWLVESNAWATQNLRREARSRGVDPDRLILAPTLPYERHLARLGAADLFLDTLPYNAHTSTSDALWVGLPVLTCPGETFASRMAGSLLTSAGMPELIVRSLPEYETSALRLARTPGELSALREKLARNRSTAPLFDTPGFVRYLESAYERMWHNYLAGNEPRRIDF
ncbi:MAG TPA: tetratricopeptide repeat protein [Burkholderiales bacterium]|nr:tetratricopeptide repeat protein [Burkholderiales bacterium]